MFDPDVKTSWGFLSCNKCGSRYQITDRPVHLSDCPVNGDNNGNGDIVYHYGMAEVAKVMKETSGRSPFGMLKRADLEAVFDKLPVEVQERMIGLGYSSR